MKQIKGSKKFWLFILGMCLYLPLKWYVYPTILYVLDYGWEIIYTEEFQFSVFVYTIITESIIVKKLKTTKNLWWSIINPAILACVILFKLFLVVISVIDICITI